MMATIRTRGATALVLAALFVLAPAGSRAANFTLPATTTGPGKIDLGFFSGGTLLSVTASGQISLISGWDVFADGSLFNPINPVGELANYGYVNAGASGYPTVNGGDGINHFPGGGANYDVNAASYGLAGAWTTDTTNPGAIRFGSVVGTFSASPARSDWFSIGISNLVVIPVGGAQLYLAVHDTTYPNNSGSFSGTISVVPEPSVFAFGCLSVICLIGRGIARTQRSSVH
jgi:hypothetical protein